MKKLILFSLSFSLALLTTRAQADQLLVLSGGGSPLGNHFSQYRQTKTIYDDLKQRYSSMRPVVMFGAGNREGEAPVLADVHRAYKQGEQTFQVMESGKLTGTRAATLANVTQFFNDPSLKKMRKDETFFMLVSDHGMPFILPDGNLSSSFDNNCIDLWNFKADLQTGKMFEGPTAQRCLSKDALRDHFSSRVSAGRVVFAMSQCYSGGFHMMSVNLKNKYPSADPRICGFTAVTEDTTASGCTPDVDGPSYQGYERSFTEHLTGTDVVSGQRLRAAQTSFQAAHAEATIEDKTKDIPLATSDFYLWKWALAIKKPGFAPRTHEIDATRARALVNSAVIGLGQVPSPAYRQKEEFFARVQKALDTYPEYRDVFNGPIESHERLVSQLESQFGQLESAGARDSQTLAQYEAVLLREWRRAVLSGQAHVTPLEAAIENQIYSTENADAMILLYMSVQAITNPDSAKAMSDYQGKRGAYALEYMESGKRQEMKDFARNLKALRAKVAAAEDQYLELQKRHGHVRRLLIYREALGALNAMTAMKDQTALSELQGLLDCESTALKN